MPSVFPFYVFQSFGWEVFGFEDDKNMGCDAVFAKFNKGKHCNTL
jgi:hypothetical protein